MKNNTRFGSSAAAIILSDIIQEHPDSDRISRKVSRLLNHFNVRAEFIESCTPAVFPIPSDTTSAMVFYGLLIEDYLYRCEQIFNRVKDVKVKSFTKNVIKARHKKWLESFSQNWL
jgi:hypothetical protein